MRRLALLIFLTVFLFPTAHAQDSDERLTVTFSDPSRPGLLRVNLINGGITVRAHAANDVVIQSQTSPGGRAPRAGRANRPPDEASGLTRIGGNAVGLSIEEDNNVMTVMARNPNTSGNLEILVPTKTNLNLKTVNGREILVEGVEGEIEVTNTNGSVTLNNVSGSVVAHATNGRVVASLRDITPNRPMSFTSMNANVDITLPATAKANLKIRTDNGESYSDFDVQPRPSGAPNVEDTRARGGRFRIQTDRTKNVAINGGGPDFDLRTLNGNIYIRKGK